MYPAAVINPELELQLEIREISNSPLGQLTGCQASWSVPERLSYLDGHFPGFPIVPGVAIIDTTIEILRRALQLESMEIQKIQSAKFMHPVEPGHKLEITLKAMDTEAGAATKWSAEWKRRQDGANTLSVADIALVLRRDS